MEHEHVSGCGPQPLATPEPDAGALRPMRTLVALCLVKCANPSLCVARRPPRAVPPHPRYSARWDTTGGYLAAARSATSVRGKNEVSQCQTPCPKIPRDD